MKRSLIPLIILLFLFAVPIYAWNWDEHILTVENVYYSMPDNLQEKLNLENLKEGSIAPDKEFHDYINHHHPRSYDKYVYYLNLSITSYSKENYKDASYYFGVASHYLTDSYAAPHYISKEDTRLHSQFEDAALDEQISINCNTPLPEDLNYTLFLESKTKEAEWENYLKTKDKKIPHQSLQKAQDLLISISKNAFSYNCVDIKAKKESQNLLAIATITSIILLALLVIFLSKSKNK